MNFESPRSAVWRSLIGMICLSLTLHMAFALWATWQSNEVLIAGGAESPATTVGEAFADTLLAGTDASEVEAETADLEEVVEAKMPEAIQPLEAIKPQAVTPDEIAEVAPVVSALTAGVVNTATEGKFIEAETTMETPLDVEAVMPEDTKPQELDETKPLEAVQPAAQMVRQEIKSVEPQPTIEQEPQKAEPQKPLEMLETAALTEPDVSEPVEQQITETVPVPALRPKPLVRDPPRPAKPQQKTEKKKVAQKASSAAGAGGSASRNAQKGGATSAGRASEAGNAAVSNYPGKIVRKLRRNRRYPTAARRQRLSGEVVVSFTVDASGRASRIRIVRSSGHASLDQAGLDTVRRSSPFPKIPPESGRKSWNFTVPIAFQR